MSYSFGGLDILLIVEYNIFEDKVQGYHFKEIPFEDFSLVRIVLGIFLRLK